MAENLMQLIYEQKKALSTAGPDERKQLETIIADNQKELGKRNLWIFSPKAAETYRSLADDLAFVPSDLTNRSSHPQITDLIDRFVQRKISSTVFVQEIIQIQRLVEMED